MVETNEHGSLTFSPTRSHARRKPRMMRKRLAFYRQADSSIFLDMDLDRTSNADSIRSSGLHDLVRESGQDVQTSDGDVPGVVQSLSKASEDLYEEVSALPLDQDHQFSYAIVGGFNSNAITVEVGDIDRDQHDLDWIALLTFTGCQITYLRPDKSGYVFALADDDAYVYCDKDPCEECVFKCKNGFVLYLHCAQHGVFSLPLSPRSKNNNRIDRGRGKKVTGDREHL